MKKLRTAWWMLRTLVAYRLIALGEGVLAKTHTKVAKHGHPVEAILLRIAHHQMAIGAHAATLASLLKAAGFVPAEERGKVTQHPNGVVEHDFTETPASKAALSMAVPSLLKADSLNRGN